MSVQIEPMLGISVESQAILPSYTASRLNECKQSPGLRAHQTEINSMINGSQTNNDDQDVKSEKEKRNAPSE